MAESLGAAVLTVSVDDAQLKAGLQAAERQAATAGQNIEKGLNRSGKATSTAASGLQYYIDAQGKARDASGRFLSIAQRQAAGIENVGKSAASAGFNLRGLGTALAGIGVGAALTGFLRGSINAAVELDSITRKLSNTLGPQGAGQALSFTKGLSDQLGLSFKTLASSFGSFTAAATAANVPLQEQQQLFAAVAKAAQALGLSNDEINGSLLALQQVAAKGTVQMEELRGQLGERLPIAFGATARGLGITQQELIKLVETGRLTASEFFPALTKGLNELTAGAGGTETASQNFQKLANAWDELQTSFGENLLPSILPQLERLTKALEGVGVVTRANKLGLGGGAITNALGVIPDQGAEAVGALKALQTQFNLTEKQANALFTDAVASVGGSTNAFGQLTLSAEQFETVLERLPSLAEEFRAKNKDVTGELNAQAAEAARLLKIEQQRAEAAKKAAVITRQDAELGIGLEATQRQINAENALAGVPSGPGKQFIQQAFAVDESIASAQDKVRSLGAQLEELRGKGVAVDSAEYKKVLNDQVLAQKEIELARAKGNNSLTEASNAYAETIKSAAKEQEEKAKQAAEEGIRGAQAARKEYESAAKSLRGALEGSFNLLTSSRQDSLTRAAQADVNRAVQAGLFDSSKVSGLKGSELLSAASQARGIFEANSQLVGSNDALTKATDKLASKDWTVNVAVNATSGDYAVQLG